MGATIRRIRERGEADERGMTVTELMVVVLMLGFVLATLFGVLSSVSANERLQQAKVNNQERVRLVLGQLTRDLRSSNPMVAPTTVADGATSVEMAIGPLSGPQTYVHWWLSGTTLTRSEAATAGGTPTASKVMLTNVRNTARGVTLLRYFRSSVAEMALTGIGAVTAGDIVNCSIRVKVAVSSDSDPGPAPFLEETDAEIRNRLPGGLGC
jgi:type II secretory pathway pseudopilin PulG